MNSHFLSKELKLKLAPYNCDIYVVKSDNILQIRQKEIKKWF